MTLIGYDIDGVLTHGVEPQGPFVIISGRTFDEYDDTCKQLAQRAPLYIRGVGRCGDRTHAGEFKAAIIKMLGISVFHEDDQLQADIIKQRNPNIKIVLHL